MEKIKSYLVIIGIILSISLILALFNLISLFNDPISWIVNLILGISLFAYIGFKSGLNTEKKGYLKGLKNGLIALAIMFLLSTLVFQIKISISMGLYYLILLIVSIFTSMLGINQKKD